MSIFDVIRYPISWPPTMVELKALPPDLYTKWATYFFDRSYTRSDIVDYYKRVSAGMATLSDVEDPEQLGYAFDEILFLRKVIARWEE